VSVGVSKFVWVPVYCFLCPVCGTLIRKVVNTHTSTNAHTHACMHIPIHTNKHTHACNTHTSSCNYASNAGLCAVACWVHKEERGLDISPLSPLEPSSTALETQLWPCHWWAVNYVRGQRDLCVCSSMYGSGESSVVALSKVSSKVCVSHKTRLLVLVCMSLEWPQLWPCHRWALNHVRR